MPYNGSGTWTRLYSWVNDKAANIKVRADRMDNEMNDMSSGLSTCITKDGQTTVTANLPMANFKHTGVGNATARTEYASAGQVQDGKLNWVAAGGTADAITASYSPAITALVDGQICFVRAGAANATTTPTFAPNGLTARTITKNGNQALAAGDIFGSGHELVLRYRLSDTKWELLNPAFPSLAGYAPLASPTFTGTVTADTIQTSGATGVVLRNSAGTTVATLGSSNTTNVTFAGTVNGVTAAIGTDSVALATTAFVHDVTPARISGLRINTAGATSVITANSIPLYDANNTGMTARNVNVTINTATAAGLLAIDTGSWAINTWYYVYVISNGTLVSAIASASSTTPTMPSGYTFRARVGAIRASGTATVLRSTQQYGNKVQYRNTGASPNANLPIIVSGAAGNVTTPTYVAVSISSFVPPTSYSIQGLMMSGGNGILVAPSTGYGDYFSLTNPAMAGNGYQAPTQFSMILESTDIYWANNAAGCALACIGWEDNL